MKTTQSNVIKIFVKKCRYLTFVFNSFQVYHKNRIKKHLPVTISLLTEYKQHEATIQSSKQIKSLLPSPHVA